MLSVYCKVLTKTFVAVTALLAAGAIQALNPEDNAVFVRIIDTGPGHAAVIRMPGNHFMVYGTGHWNQDNLVRDRIQEIIPTSQSIDLLVFSHSDSDHLAATDELFGLYTINRVLRGGLERTNRATWRDSNTAIETARTAGTTTVVNLRRSDIEPGATS